MALKARAARLHSDTEKGGGQSGGGVTGAVTFLVGLLICAYLGPTQMKNRLRAIGI